MAAGKAAVRQNATTHGIFSNSPVVGGVESLEEWEEFRIGILEGMHPDGVLELELAERIARLLWRLRRVSHAEEAAIELEQARLIEADAPTRAAREQASGEVDTLDRLLRIISRPRFMWRNETVQKDDMLQILRWAAAVCAWNGNRLVFDASDLEDQDSWPAEELSRRAKPEAHHS